MRQKQKKIVWRHTPFSDAFLFSGYDDILTARIIEKVIVHSRQEIEIYFIGGYTQKIDLI